MKSVRPGIKFKGLSNAKINLFLYVTGKRQDGYHNIHTLFVPISLCDTITLTPAISTSFHCNVKNLSLSHNNIIMKTDSVMRNDFGLNRHFHIDLVKRIPIGAGLGGGSSNAATYMELVSRASGLRLSEEDKRKIMENVGSDTSFFLLNRPAIGEGRGEILSCFDYLPDFFLNIINPRIHVSTKDIFTSPFLKYTDEKYIKNVTEKLSFKDMVSMIHNDMEAVVFRTHPSVKRIADCINQGGYGFGGMSGSGSSVFGVYESEESRDKDYERIKSEYPAYFIKKAEVLNGDTEII